MRVLIARRMLTHAAGLLGKVSRTHGCAGPGGYSHPSARPKTDPVSSPAGSEPPICSPVSGSESAASVEPRTGGKLSSQLWPSRPSLLGHSSTCGPGQTCLFVFGFPTPALTSGQGC